MPAHILEQYAPVGGLVGDGDGLLFPGGFDRREAHDGKGQNDQRQAGQRRAHLTTAQIAHADDEGGGERTKAADFRGFDMRSPTLQGGHLPLETQKDDTGHHDGQSQDKKSQDDH